jgi:hypothetical protein
MSGQSERKKRRHDRGEWLPVEDEEQITVMNAASARDRRYFARNPKRERYVRRKIPGEYGDLESEPRYRFATHTLVTQIAPWYRTREPMVLLRHRDYPSGIIPAEHVEAAAALVGADEMFEVPDNDLDDDDDEPDTAC